jgi:hypothetical protein
MTSIHRTAVSVASLALLPNTVCSILEAAAAEAQHQMEGRARPAVEALLPGFVPAPAVAAAAALVHNSALTAAASRLINQVCLELRDLRLESAVCNISSYTS